MPLTAQHIITRARILLNDEDGTRWPDGEMLIWLSDALLAAVMAKPSAATEHIVVDLVVGTIQRLPDTAATLVRVIANVDAQDVPTNAVTMTERATLDQHYTGWHNPTVAPFNALVEQVAHDPLEPDTFYVYPGNDGNGRLMLAVAPVPDDVTTLESEIPFSPLYRGAFTDYLVHRAYMKDGESAAAAAKSQAHLQLFNAALGLQGSAELGANPDSANAVEV